jgi:hypothetical protein
MLGLPLSARICQMIRVTCRMCRLFAQMSPGHWQPNNLHVYIYYSLTIRQCEMPGQAGGRRWQKVGQETRRRRRKGERVWRGAQAATCCMKKRSNLARLLTVRNLSHARFTSNEAHLVPRVRGRGRSMY